ncbi:MAG: CRISPR-associated helicase Cas3' [Acidobacteria bacterium]|nr:CRISPR-associated helicase Cas3' [Acidobacteriota bacterium]
MKIQSHYDPRLYLQSHLVQVWVAAEFLFKQHSNLTCSLRSETALVLKAMVDCHDLGKASPAFQSYIADPKNYKGDPREKSHASLSTAIALIWAKTQNWTPLQALALAQAVSGHHSGFASLDGLLEDRLRANDDLMQKQMEKIDYEQLSIETGLNLTNLIGNYWDGATWLRKENRRKHLISALSQEEKLKYRIWVEFLFSILLEADKAFLALKNQGKTFLSLLRPTISLDLIDKYLASKEILEINQIRNHARTKVKENLEKALNDNVNKITKLYTITLPTGIGKTLIAADFALTMREKMTQENKGKAPQIIIVLPYLSIIDQTVSFYRELLQTNDSLDTQIDSQTDVQTELLMASHSLSERSYNLDGEKKEQRFSDFFIDTWRSEIILTTFDQLLLTIFSSDTKHLMRFHHLMDSIIIFDEVQTLPCKLWHPVSNVLAALCQEANSRLLMMSATQPGILLDAFELVGSQPEVKQIFTHFSRYRLLLKHQQTKTISDFLLELETRLPDYLDSKTRLLITLNTRASARRVWKHLSSLVDELNSPVPIFLITSDVTPKDRLAKISRIKKGQPCIVVSTQCIEAGVDIDMDYVIRDFAPLDSIIQVAGRCNRNSLKLRAIVEIIRLQSDKNRPYDEQIYDSVHLSVTHQVLSNLEEILEEEIFEIVEKYFQKLKENKNLGEQLTKNFAEWLEDIDIRKELRGEHILEVDFLILHATPIEQGDLVDLEQEENNLLKAMIEKALKIADRWERRSELRKLSAKIQKRTVSVYANKINPNLYATPINRGIIPYFWVLEPKYYNAQTGLDLLLDEEDPSCTIF